MLVIEATDNTARLRLELQLIKEHNMWEVGAMLFFGYPAVYLFSTELQLLHFLGIP